MFKNVLFYHKLKAETCFDIFENYEALQLQIPKLDRELNSPNRTKITSIGSLTFWMWKIGMSRKSNQKIALKKVKQT